MFLPLVTSLSILTPSILIYSPTESLCSDTVEPSQLFSRHCSVGSDVRRGPTADAGDVVIYALFSVCACFFLSLSKAAYHTLLTPCLGLSSLSASDAGETNTRAGIENVSRSVSSIIEQDGCFLVFSSYDKGELIEKVLFCSWY